MALWTRALAGGCAALVVCGACSSVGAPEKSTTSPTVSTSSPPASTTSTTEPVLGFVEQTAALIDDLAVRGQFSGVALIGHGDDVVWERAAPGVCSFLNIYPETGHTVVVLSNSDDDCLPVLLHRRDHPPSR